LLAVMTWFVAVADGDGAVAVERAAIT
jgi:hypothetical protein